MKPEWLRLPLLIAFAAPELDKLTSGGFLIGGAAGHSALSLFYCQCTILAKGPMLRKTGKCKARIGCGFGGSIRRKTVVMEGSKKRRMACLSPFFWGISMNVNC